MPAATREYSCWLVKSEPDCFSIEDLAGCPEQTTCWSGVRNYQARNFMRDLMQLGDRVLFYHSSTDPPAVAGTAIVAREAYPDHTAWDPSDDHYDPKASPHNPIWQMVDVRLDRVFQVPVPIGALRAAKALKNMELLRTGSRLSVQPVREREFEVVLHLADSLANQSAGGPAKTKTSAPRALGKKIKKAARPKPAKRKGSTKRPKKPPR